MTHAQALELAMQLHFMETEDIADELLKLYARGKIAGIHECKVENGA